MKKYKLAELDITYFEAEDIICTSGDDINPDDGEGTPSIISGEK